MENPKQKWDDNWGYHHGKTETSRTHWRSAAKENRGTHGPSSKSLDSLNQEVSIKTRGEDWGSTMTYETTRCFPKETGLGKFKLGNKILEISDQSLDGREEKWGFANASFKF